VIVLGFFTVVALIFVIMITDSWSYYYRSELFLAFFFFALAVLWLGGIYLAITLQKIKQGGERIAGGDLEYKISTDYMYGDFKDFSGYTPKLDRQISLIEVESDTRYYDRALRLGWHLAPTMSQNNHAGQWGGLDGRRTVLLARGLTEEALYDALRNYRVYATQDPDLEILFSMDGHPMGSRVPRHSLGNTLTLECQLYDPTDPALGTLEVVTQDGCVLETLSLEGPKADLSLTLPANRDYYYLRLTQPDGSWAVTAPIWLDEQNHLGISEISLSPTLTAGKPETVTVTLYNAEPQDLTVSHVTLQVGETLYTHT
jgi:hypothetical protein